MRLNLSPDESGHYEPVKLYHYPPQANLDRMYILTYTIIASRSVCAIAGIGSTAQQGADTRLNWNPSSGNARMTRYQLAKLVQWAGTLRTRKRMQKVVYLLQLAGCP